MDRHYDVLGVTPEADRTELRHAYRTLSKEHHPDQGGSRLEFLRIKRAYEEITGESAPDSRETDGGAITQEAVDDGRSHSKPDPALVPDPDPDSNPDPAPGSNPDPTFEPPASTQEPTPRTGHGLRIGGDLLTVTLAGLAHERPLEELVGGRVNPGVTRTVAFFEVENVSDQTLEWCGGSNTNFVGDDGFLYEGSNIVAPHAHTLPPQWCVADVEIDPGRALRAVVVAGEIPDGVTVERVVYTQHALDEPGDDTGQTERYLFEIRPRVRDALDHVPFGPVDGGGRDGDSVDGTAHTSGNNLESDADPETDPGPTGSPDPNRDDDPEYDVDFDGEFEFRIE